MEPSEILSKLPRYEFRRELGRGSSGVVCEVFDKVRDQNVALKLVHEGADDLAGEFLVMARLPPHPALARPLDYHPFPSLACFTMELARGTPLSSLMHEDGSRRLIGTVIPAVLAGMSMLHSHGFVHGDLKPANIVIYAGADPADTAVRIVDLGLTRSFTSGGNSRPSGTWRYMAPEIFLGHPTDARADLYSLGVILHEWITGAPPFDAESPRELARRVLFEPPPAIDAGAGLPDSPAALPDVIRKLMARRPEERYSDCVSVAADLAAPSQAGGNRLRSASRSVRTAGPAPGDAPGSEDVSPTLFLEPPFFDRNAEMARLEMAFDRASRGTPVFVSLSGAPGAGRTRLLRELRFHTLSRVSEWHEEPPGLDEHGRDPLTRFGESLAARTGSPGGGSAAAEAPADAGHDPADVRHDPAEYTNRPPAGNDLSERVRRLERLLPLVAEGLARSASRGTVVAIFEEGADRDGSIEASLEFISAELAEGRILFVLITAADQSGAIGVASPGKASAIDVASPEKVSAIDAAAPEKIFAAGAPAGVALPSEHSEGRLTIHVPPLPPAAVAEIVRFLRGDKASEEQVSRLVSMSGGMPLHAVMLTRAAATSVDGPRGGDMTGWLPASHEEFFRSERERYRADGSTAWTILETVAVLEPLADLRAVLEVTGLATSDVLENLARLSRPGGPLVASRHDGRPAYRFAQPVFSKWIEREIEPSCRRLLHRRAAEVLAAGGSSSNASTEFLESMARHWCAAGDDSTAVAEAIRWCHRAGVRAADKFDWTAGREWIGQALELLTSSGTADPELQPELLGLLARSCALSGANEEAAELFRRLADETPDPVTGARAIGRHAQILLATLGETNAGTGAVRDALARLPEGVADLERARLLEIASDGARIRGEMEEAVSKGVESLRLLEKANAGPTDISRVLATLGYARLFTGDAILSRTEIERARDLARTAGDLYAEARALSHLAVVEGHLGDYPAVRRHLEASADLAERINDVRRLTAIDQSLAVADYYEAHFEDARRRLVRGRRRAVAIGDRQILAYFDLTLGNVERSAGRFEAARAAFHSCAVQASVSGIALARSLAETGLGWVALSRGRLEEARRHLTASPEDAAQDPLATMQQQCVLGFLSLEEGDARRALELGDQAMESARAVGSPKFEPLAIDLRIRAGLESGVVGDDELLRECERGFDLSERLQVAEYAVNLLGSRSLIELKAGRPETAVEFAGEAVRRARSRSLLPALVRVLHIEARTWMARGGIWDDRAEDAFEECMTVAGEIGMRKALEEAGAGLEMLRRAWDG